MTKRNRLIVFLLAIVLLPYAASAERATRETTYDFELNPGGKFTLENVNGDVQLRGGSGNRVEIIATKRGREENFDLVEVRIDATPERIHVRTEYPRYKRNLDVSVDYVVSLPESAVLDEIDTVNGNVQIENVHGFIRTSSVNGSIDVVNARSAVKSHTVNGSIDVQIESLSPSDEVSMESVNGSLKLALPSSVNADLSASTLNGSIETDFPITVQGKFLGKRINGKIGSGGTRINLETTNGRIRVTGANQ